MKSGKIIEFKNFLKIFGKSLKISEIVCFFFEIVGKSENLEKMKKHVIFKIYDK